MKSKALISSLQFLLFVCSCKIESGISQSLKAEFLTPLPDPIYGSSSVYDGEDLIYLLGGLNHGIQVREILRFNVSSGLIDVVGTIPSTYTNTLTAAQIDSQGRIFYFGATLQANQVYMFEPSSMEDESAHFVASLPYSAEFATLVKFGNDLVAILGAGRNQKEILIFDMKTNEVIEVDTKLPFAAHSHHAVLMGNNITYLFGSNDVELEEPIPNTSFKFDLNTFEMILEGPEDFPDMDYYDTPASVTDGTNIFVIGGYSYRLGNGNPSVMGILKVNPVDLSWNYIPVADIPIYTNEYYFYAPSSVYVEKLHRIYFFGGLTEYLGFSEFKYRDDVWYVDLGPILQTNTA